MSRREYKRVLGVLLFHFLGIIYMSGKHKDETKCMDQTVFGF